METSLRIRVITNVKFALYLTIHGLVIGNMTKKITCYGENIHFYTSVYTSVSTDDFIWTRASSVCHVELNCLQQEI